ncbi:MAG: hypothetical protein K2X03_28430 [Bryobacteraceae bacterium]|nr:hypothetical protein [Bryobacteraceae bacterium]
MALGVLVYGDNHLILRGPRPSLREARQLAGHYGLSLTQIGSPADGGVWSISVREFRENLEWAVRLTAESATTPAVEELLAGLAQRGIEITEESACAS